MFLWPLRWALRLVALLVLVAVVGFGWFAVRYRSLEWWWAPSTLHVLGAAYHREPGTLSSSQLHRRAPALRTVGHLPLGQSELVAPAAHSPSRLYLHELDGRYLVYARTS